jgi:hypothetical protein
MIYCQCRACRKTRAEYPFGDISLTCMKERAAQLNAFEKRLTALLLESMESFREQATSKEQVNG